MTPHPIERLYREFIAASDAAARSGNEDRARILDLEAQICTELARERGKVTVNNMCFQLFVVVIDDRRLQYFKVTVAVERRTSTAGYSFQRRKTDVEPVIPMAAQQRHPKASGSIRRKISA